MENNDVAVLGSGSWGTAIVKILLNNVEKVNWWIREAKILDHLKNYSHNPQYLSSVQFDTSRLHLSNDINLVIKKSKVVIFCVPAAYLHGVMGKIEPGLLNDKFIVSAVKGIVPEYNMIVGDYFRNNHNIDFENTAVVTGPSHAEEVALEKLTYLTVASSNQVLAKEVSTFFHCRYIKVSLSDDIIGTEYAPVLKNIFAIASGICNGLGYGDNFQAVLISNAIKEIKVFLNLMSPMERDINDAVYLGDLLVTSYSQFSRNRMFGNMIGKGYSVKFARYEMKMIVEGYYAVKGIYQLTRELNLEMPVTETVYNILYNDKMPGTEINKLSESLR